MSSSIDIKRFLAAQGSMAASRGEIALEFRQTFADQLPAACVEFVARRIDKAMADMPWLSDFNRANFQAFADVPAVKQLIEEMQANTQHWCLQATKSWVELWAALNDDQD